MNRSKVNDNNDGEKTWEREGGENETILYDGQG